MATRPYFWKYHEMTTPYGKNPQWTQMFQRNGINNAAAADMWLAEGMNYTIKTDQWNALFQQVNSGQAYDKNLYEQLIAPHTYDIWYNSGGKAQVDQWHQADLAEQKRKQDEELARQKAEQERLRAEQEAKAREQAAALERQRQAAEKARKEAEFKLALDAMNQRANVKRTDEVVGEISETPEQAAQRKKKRVGYDATKVTGILGAAPTESKKLLGM